MAKLKLREQKSNADTDAPTPATSIPFTSYLKAKTSDKAKYVASQIRTDPS
uniref:Uncharacterized protein n=1 Tax=Vitis vinifera TaxID=29760 RepID=A5BRG9_VITVI|nr:hypothetical protein VITISV_026833 [Vitis vinifera]